MKKDKLLILSMAFIPLISTAIGGAGDIPEPLDPNNNEAVQPAPVNGGPVVQVVPFPPPAGGIYGPGMAAVIGEMRGRINLPGRGLQARVPIEAREGPENLPPLERLAYDIQHFQPENLRPVPAPDVAAEAQALVPVEAPALEGNPGLNGAAREEAVMDEESEEEEEEASEKD